jgi:hypothetical protein
MTRYSRSVIPGRQTGEAPTLASEIDSLVFGKDGPKGKGAEADGEDAEPVSEGEAIDFIERAASDRRRGSKRRGSDFAPLPGEAAVARSSEGGSKRGPILLAGALVIVAVFGVVVWNAYRDGVRPEDSAVAPQLADAGPFKSKPAQTETKAKAAGPAEESVFDQVEARPNATPAPEVREAEAAPEPVPAPVETAQAEPPKPAPVKAAPVKAAPAPAAKAAAPKAAATPPAPKPVQVAVATKQATPVTLSGGYSPAFASGGRFVVQIAAPASEDGAIAEWNKGKKKAPGLFQSAERIIVQADVNGHTVYRLRAGSFATGADADAFCDAFKAAGGQCFRTAK